MRRASLKYVHSSGDYFGTVGSRPTRTAKRRGWELRHGREFKRPRRLSEDEVAWIREGK
jgi:hypothetical protein